MQAGTTSCNAVVLHPFISTGRAGCNPDLLHHKTQSLWMASVGLAINSLANLGQAFGLLLNFASEVQCSCYQDLHSKQFVQRSMTKSSNLTLSCWIALSKNHDQGNGGPEAIGTKDQFGEDFGPSSGSVLFYFSKDRHLQSI